MTILKNALVLLALIAAYPLLGQIETPTQHYPTAGTAIKLGDIPALSTLTPHTTPPNTGVPTGKSWKRPNYFFKNKINNTDALPKNGDPLAKKKDTATPDASGPEVVVIHNFDGLRDPDGVSPPDPTGDVGTNHYVQMVNASGGARFRVWDKQGNSVYGPALTSTIWSEVNSGSIGDPIIQFDPGAQRWLMMEMQGFNENQLLIAMSDTDDPTGSWKAWRIQCVGFPDYPKLYVWDNSYFVTVNEIVQGNQCVGYALDKGDMLNGLNSVSLYRFQMPNYLAIQYQPATGADWEGGPPPPPGSPGLIFRVYDDAWDGGNDQIQMWQIFVDWANPSANVALGPLQFPVAPFETRVCYGNGLFSCIEQPNTNNRITALENIIMYRAPYRNFGTHESIVLNHITDVSNQSGDGGDAAMRWYEFRKNAGQNNWFVYQQGTYAPDAENRFMGTLSIDAQGNIGAGYSVASIVTYPGLRITGRRSGDPLGEMPVQEYTLINGTASHTGDNRWGDYSTTAVDPVDGKTFWFVGEYQPNNDDWGTRIGAFQIRRDTYDITPDAIIAPQNAADLTNVAVTVRISNQGLELASNINADLYVDGALLASESVSGSIEVNQTTQHTFQPLLTWNLYNETKQIMVVTRWTQDEFTRNDTIRTVVKKLTSFDAAYGGMAGLPNLICSASYDLNFLLKNTSGLPLDSVQIRWKLNQGTFQIRKWYGHILPGQQDTVVFSFDNLLLPQNIFSGQILLPNGQPDQDSTNNKFTQKIYTNLNGSYLTTSATTALGNLHVQVFNSNNQLLDQVLFVPGTQSREVCVTDGECYKVTVRSTTFKWEGLMQVKDLYGNVLVSITSATPFPENINICAPTRKAKDIGAFAMLSPANGPNLGTTEPVTIQVKNFGTQSVSAFDVAWRVDGGNWNTETFNADLGAGASQSFTFSSTADLSTLGKLYNFEIKTALTADELPSNDVFASTVRNQAALDLAIELQSTACADVNQNGLVAYLHNYGLTKVDSIRVSVNANGNISSEFFETFGIEPGSTLPITLPLPAGLTGTNTASVTILQVNDQNQDDVPDNNTAQISYEIDPSKAQLVFAISTDTNGDETSWELRDSNGDLVDTGGNYPSVPSYDARNYCLDADQCFTLKVFDSGNDGMDGFIDLMANSSVIWTYNGAVDTFTNVLTVNFCLSDECADFNATFAITPLSSAGATDGKITITAQGGTPPYEYALGSGAWQSDNQFEGLAAGNYIAKTRDANDCVFESSPLTMGTVGTSGPTALNPVEVYPNPTHGPVWVKMAATNNETGLTCHISNSEGKHLRTIDLTRFDQTIFGNFSIQKLPAGTYWITILNQKGIKIAEKRIQKI